MEMSKNSNNNNPYNTNGDNHRHDDPPEPPPAEPPQPEKVELAVLTLPRSAMQGGLEVGDNDHVVLEATNETIEQLRMGFGGGVGGTVSDNDDDDDDGDGDDDAATAANTLNTLPTTTTTDAHPSIQGVVNLEILSELVGATEEDLIIGLQHELRECREAAAAAAAEGSQSHRSEEPDEETPLIASLSQAPVTVTETDDGLETVTETGVEQITLLADPFLETLAECLPPIQEDEVATVAGDTTLFGETITLATTTIGAVAGTDQEHSNEHVEEQHFSHDAFLLDVPTTDEQGNLEHHFVLALPEIQVEESVQTATSALSGDEGSFALMERAMSLLPTTMHLPSDIENVHLEATEHIPTKQDPSQIHIDVIVERKTPIIGYIILFSGLFALASVGAALDLQGGGVTPTMKTLWRQLATSMILVPFVVKSLVQDGVPHLSLSQWSLLPVSAAAYAYMTLAFVIALELTTLANAVRSFCFESNYTF